MKTAFLITDIDMMINRILSKDCGRKYAHISQTIPLDNNKRSFFLGTTEVHYILFSSERIQG